MVDLTNDMIHKIVYYTTKESDQKPTIFVGIINGISVSMNITFNKTTVHATIKCLNYIIDENNIIEDKYIFNNREEILNYFNIDRVILKKYKPFINKLVYIYYKNYHFERELKQAIIKSIYIGYNKLANSYDEEIKIACVCKGYYNSEWHVTEKELFLYELFEIVLNNKYKIKITKNK